MKPSVHANQQLTQDEPVGGWMSGPTLHDTEILSIVLCRYTGVVPGYQTGECPQRLQAHHPDVECRTLYHQQDALVTGKVHYDMTAAEVTVPAAGDEPTYQHPMT